jgi:hypothetical protein
MPSVCALRDVSTASRAHSVAKRCEPETLNPKHTVLASVKALPTNDGEGRVLFSGGGAHRRHETHQCRSRRQYLIPKS